MKRNERGMARSDITHMIMCMLSGVRLMKSQKLSWADWACGKPLIRFRLHRMDEVREPDGVLDEEDRDVVADDVPVAFLGIELDGKAAHVAGEVERPLLPATVEKRTKAGVFSPARWKMSARCVFGERVVGLEIAMRAIAPRMNNALGNALVIEVEDLLAEMKVLDQAWPALADPKCFWSSETGPPWQSSGPASCPRRSGGVRHHCHGRRSGHEIRAVVAPISRYFWPSCCLRKRDFLAGNQCCVSDDQIDVFVLVTLLSTEGSGRARNECSDGQRKGADQSECGPGLSGAVGRLLRFDLGLLDAL